MRVGGRVWGVGVHEGEQQGRGRKGGNEGKGRKAVIIVITNTTQTKDTKKTNNIKSDELN